VTLSSVWAEPLQENNNSLSIIINKAYYENSMAFSPRKESELMSPNNFNQVQMIERKEGM